jgi:molybdopterin-containing oxidoreductase family iron-sulfur binding subunit
MSQIEDEYLHNKPKIMNEKVTRREFMQVVGLGGLGATLAGCDATTITLEEGKEDIVSYLSPEEYVIPGVGTWYASTCLQCPAMCGIHGRVREGRVLKIEGNPDSPVSNGKACQMGQAGLQNHFNPDRILKPMVRKNGKLVETDWKSALEKINKHVGDESGLAKNEVAWFTGTVSGHQKVLIQNHLDSLNSDQHFVNETVNNAVWQRVCSDTLGDDAPIFSLDKASLIVSFGADFLGTMDSPIHYSKQYSDFRSLPDRGSLIQIESKMSLTGGNADLWITLKPGTEGIFAMGLARYLLDSEKLSSKAIPNSVKENINSYDIKNVTKITGADENHIQRVGDALISSKQSLVIAGPSVGGHSEGYQSSSAIMMLNMLLGNIGKTITPQTKTPLSDLHAMAGGTSDLVSLSESLKAKKLKAVFFYGANPVYSAPDSLGLVNLLQGDETFKVSVSSFPDETTMQADVVLPASSYLEDWGTHVASQGPGQGIVSMQQPLMERWKGSAKGLGDIVLDLLKMAAPGKYKVFPDYYSYIRGAIRALPNSGLSDENFWEQALQNGSFSIRGSRRIFNLKWPNVELSEPKTDSKSPLYLVPSPRVGLFDGRHANLPWLQESPDQISKVVWDSWAEVHPKTAESLGIGHGEFINIVSDSGTINVKAYLTKAVNQNVVAVPLGQGHEGYGRFADGIGVNPLKILSSTTEPETGELAMYGTRVSAIPTGEFEKIVRMGGSDSQVGRGLVRTVSATQVKNTGES